MTDDTLAMKILLARCLGTLEGIYGALKLPEDSEKQILKLIQDIKKATGLKE